MTSLRCTILFVASTSCAVGQGLSSASEVALSSANDAPVVETPEWPQPAPVPWPQSNPCAKQEGPCQTTTPGMLAQLGKEISSEKNRGTVIGSMVGGGAAVAAAGAGIGYAIVEGLKDDKNRTSVTVAQPLLEGPRKVNSRTSDKDLPRKAIFREGGRAFSKITSPLSSKLKALDPRLKVLLGALAVAALLILLVVVTLFACRRRPKVDEEKPGYSREMSRGFRTVAVAPQDKDSQGMATFDSRLPQFFRPAYQQVGIPPVTTVLPNVVERFVTPPVTTSFAREEFVAPAVVTSYESYLAEEEKPLAFAATATYPYDASAAAAYSAPAYRSAMAPAMMSFTAAPGYMGAGTTSFAASPHMAGSFASMSTAPVTSAYGGQIAGSHPGLQVSVRPLEPSRVQVRQLDDEGEA